MSDLDALLASNKAWAAGRREGDPGFFSRLVAQQAPSYLWIGCSDSRVPANEIVGLDPGELFVHRNVANVVVHTDLNCLSVLQFAVEVLRVRHVMVVGHYGCGGIKAAWETAPLGLIDNWLRHIEDVADRHREALEAIPEQEVLLDRLSDLNVLTQVVNVCRTTIVQDAWQRGQPLAVHGLIYGLKDGNLRDLGLTRTGPEGIEEAYRDAVDRALAG